MHCQRVRLETIFYVKLKSTSPWCPYVKLKSTPLCPPISPNAPWYLPVHAPLVNCVLDSTWKNICGIGQQVFLSTMVSRIFAHIERYPYLSSPPSGLGFLTATLSLIWNSCHNFYFKIKHWSRFVEYLFHNF